MLQVREVKMVRMVSAIFLQRNSQANVNIFLLQPNCSNIWNWQKGCQWYLDTFTRCPGIVNYRHLCNAASMALRTTPNQQTEITKRLGGSLDDAGLPKCKCKCFKVSWEKRKTCNRIKRVCIPPLKKLSFHDEDSYGRGQLRMSHDRASKRKEI